MANEEQARYWNELGGPEWVAHELEHDVMLEPFHRDLLGAAAPRLGEHALDVGCGFGTTTLALAVAVGKTGRVVAVDVSEPMVARLQSRVAAEALTNVIASVADAQVEPLPADYFDVALSRFGVMFFDDPVAAFTNLRASLRDRARLVFVCWQERERNPFMTVPLEAIAPLVGPPASTAGEPGPFALADRDGLDRVLRGAGFTRIDIRPVEHPMLIGAGRGLDAAVSASQSLGPVRRALATLDDDGRAEGARLLRDALAPYDRDGSVVFDGAAWLVTAG